MATTVINANGTAANTSADIVLADNASSILHLSGPAAASAQAAVPNDASAVVEIKDTAGNYLAITTLDAKNPIRQVFGPATYRVRKASSGSACSVERD